MITGGAATYKLMITFWLWSLKIIAQILVIYW